jgi:glycosyltransferase involved in cell wall biosynthesis
MNPAAPFSVYCVAGCDVCTTLEYRVLQKQEQLAQVGIAFTATGPKGLSPFDEEQFRRCDVLLLYRMAAGAFIDQVIQDARSRGVPVVFDIDDLVFAPELAFQVDALKAMAPAGVAQYYQSLWLYRSALMASDYVLTSTEPLAAHARALGKATWVHPNGLSQWMLEAGDAVIAARRTRRESDPLVIGYGSGTPSHRRDLAEVGGALARVMDAHPGVELHIAGPLHLDDPHAVPDSLRPFATRIKHLPLASWQAWLETLGRFDINLAPLQAGVPFCEAKSAIKYTEAAAVGVPTVASRTAVFAEAIRDGETGFLADSADAWTDRLERLARDPNLRLTIGAAARQDVLQRYTPPVLGRKLAEMLQTLCRTHAARRASAQTAPPHTPLILNWIIPEPLPGSGGCTNIVRIMNLLAALGHRINVYVTPLPINPLPPMTELELRAHLSRHFAPINGNVFRWSGEPMAPSDAIFVTLWSTAPYAQTHASATGKVFYFVQDWEPFFFPMGEGYLLAEQTYKMGLSCITLGKWLTDRLRSWYGADADYFDFAVDRTIYYPRKAEARRKPRICFYARPSTPRRLYPMGIRALELVHRRRPDAEIVFFGCADRDLQAAPIAFPYRNHGILSENELAELFSSATAGVVLSATNCSLLPPEMMACKCAVVDLNRETVQGVLEHEVNALLAEPSPESIAAAVLRLLDDEPLRERLVARAFEQVQHLSWEHAAKGIEAILRRKLPAARRGAERALWPAPARLPATAALPAHQQECLAALRRERRRWLAQLRAVTQDWRRRVLERERPTMHAGKRVQTVGELTARRCVGQSFIAHHAGLHRVDVFVSTFGRVNTGDVVFRLQEASGATRDVAEVQVSASLMSDNSFVSFCFSPQPASGGKAYRLTLQAPGAVPGDAITLWAYRQVELPEARLDRNGRPRDGHLVFGLYYKDAAGGEFGERPLTQHWVRAMTGFGYLMAPVRALLAEGWPGMRREGAATGTLALDILYRALLRVAPRRASRRQAQTDSGG